MKTWNEQDGRLHRVVAIEQDENTVHVSGGALDSIVRLATAESILHNLRQDRKFAKTMDGIDKSIMTRLRCAETKLYKAENRILSALEEPQLKAVINTCGNVNVTISAMPVSMCDNVEHDDMRVIVRAATSSENCASCIRSDDEVKACRLRKALDTVLGMEQRGGMVVRGMCQYGAMWGGARDEYD